MKLSNKGRYGVRAMFDIAFHGSEKSSQIKDIAERQAIPPRFLEQIFQDLKRAGLVSSKRGPRGGYQLAQSSADITLAHVVRALEGPLNLESAEGDSLDVGDPASIGVTEAAFRTLTHRIEDCLKQVSLEDLCEQAQEMGVRRTPAGGYNYVI